MQVNVLGFTRTFPKIVSEIITECGVSEPCNPAVDGKQHPVIQTAGLWDTGATNSVITKALATQLGLKPIKTINSHHAGGTSVVNVYLINIYLPNSVAISYAQVSECVDTIGRFGVLIGMDIFSKGDFALTNSGGQTTISFRMPSVQPIHLERDCLPPGAKAQINQRTQNAPTAPTKPLINPNSPRNKPCPCGSGKLFKRCHGLAQ